MKMFPKITEKWNLCAKMCQTGGRVRQNCVRSIAGFCVTVFWKISDVKGMPSEGPKCPSSSLVWKVAVKFPHSWGRVQRLAKVFVRGLVNFVPALAYKFHQTTYQDFSRSLYVRGP